MNANDNHGEDDRDIMDAVRADPAYRDVVRQPTDDRAPLCIICGCEPAVNGERTCDAISCQRAWSKSEREALLENKWDQQRDDRRDAERAKLKGGL